MIANIIDQRQRPYRWKSIQAIVEAVWHDNSCNDSDQGEIDDSGDDYVLFDERIGVSVAEAVDWAHGLACPVTLYIYDLDGDIGGAG